MLAISDAYRPLFAGLNLCRYESVAGFFNPGPPAERTGVVVRPGGLPLEPSKSLPVYYKEYNEVPASWSFIGRASKAVREYENYAVFQRLQLPCAEPIACGEQRDGLGRLRQAFIITRAIPEALTLLDFVARHCPDRRTLAARQLRASLRTQLANCTRRLHEVRFFHHDLVWRNVLVTWQPPASPRLWFIDCPRGGFGRKWPWRHRRRLKDLASLDKSAARFCSLGERVAFLRGYLGQLRWDGEGRQLARDAVEYRRARWPEDWTGR